MNTCYIAFGSNQKKPIEQLKHARNRLKNIKQLKELRASSIYQSKAWGFSAQDDFYNAVIAYQTTLTPYALLKLLQNIEKIQGRKRLFKNAPRTLDLDLILYGTLNCNTPKLTLPHPLFHKRSFVLAPLLEINPNYKHPRYGKGKLLLKKQNIKREILNIFSWDN